jgi:uncharacterized protein (TIGR02145 family)
MKFSSIIIVSFNVFAFLFANPLLAQPPQLIPYQAIARDNAGNPVLNQNIGLRFSIHDQTINGAVVWQEAQTVVSNNLGIIVTALGGTTQLTSVDWGSGAKFLQVEMDIAGGSSYLDMGTQQMMSVPYALYAETAGTISTTGSSNFNAGSTSLLGDTLYTQNNDFIIIPGLSAANNGGLDATCGAENILNHNLSYGSLTDIDGNLYKTIQIGSQEWMAENLKVSHYSDGSQIEFVPNEIINGTTAVWSNLSSGGYTWYNDDSSTYDCPYGKLYNGIVVGNSVEVCPVGWHVPTGDEWLLLESYLGGWQVSGGRMKSVGYEYWGQNPDFYQPNYVGLELSSNSSGFSALPAGNIYPGSFHALTGGCGFWSSSVGEPANSLEINTLKVYTIGTSLPLGNLHAGHSIRSGFSIRCVRD